MNGLGIKVWFDDPEEDQTIYRWEDGVGQTLNSSEVAGELNALQRDSERLEWLVTNQCRVVDVGAGNESWEVREMAGNFPLGGPLDDWRDAIDEAMRGSDEHH